MTKKQSTTDAQRSPRLTLLNVTVGVVCAGIVALAVWMAVNPGKQKVAGLLQQAGDLFSKGDCQSALGDYDEVLRIDGANRQALIGRARCLLKLKQYDEAMAPLRRLQPPDPETTRSFAAELARVGQDAMKKKSWEPARDAFRRSIELEPASAEVMVLIGRACLELDLPDDAVAHFGSAIQVDPQNADAHFYRGCAFLKKRQYDKALADFERLVQQIDPDNRLGYASRKEYAEAYLGQGTAVRGAAKQLLREAISAHRGREGTLAQAKMQQAVDLFTKGIRHDPANALLYSRRGTCLRQLGQLDAAADDLTRAITVGSQDVDLDLLYRGFVFLKIATRRGTDPAVRKELLEKAKADYLAARERNPENADAEYLLAECYVQLGDCQAAIGPYDNAIKKHPQWPDPWFSLRDAYFYQGNCFLLAGDLAKAADDFSRALNLTGDFTATPAETAGVLHALAAEFAKRKQFREANEWNEKAIGLAPAQAAKE